MAGSVNKVILLGNVGKDPEIRSTQSGSKLASFSIATSKRWKDKQTQEYKDKTEWHKIVIFGEGLVDIVEKYVKKGSKLYLEGELVTRKWSDQQGNDRYTTEIVLQGYNSTLTLLDNRNNNQSVSDNQSTSSDIDNNPVEKIEKSSDSNIDDDIPF